MATLLKGGQQSVARLTFRTDLTRQENSACSRHRRHLARSRRSSQPQLKQIGQTALARGMLSSLWLPCSLRRQ